MTEQERKTRGPAGPHRGGQGRVGLPGRGGAGGARRLSRLHHTPHCTPRARDLRARTGETLGRTRMSKTSNPGLQELRAKGLGGTPGRQAGGGTVVKASGRSNI